MLDRTHLVLATSTIARCIDLHRALTVLMKPLQRSHRHVDDLLSQGQLMLEGLREQRITIKGIQVLSTRSVHLNWLMF